MASVTLLSLIMQIATIPARAAQPTSYHTVKVAITAMLAHINRVDTEATLPYGRENKDLRYICDAKAGCLSFDVCYLEVTQYVPGKWSTTNDKRLDLYSRIAETSVWLQGSMAEVGYPSSVWQPVINDFETYELAHQKTAHTAKDKYINQAAGAQGDEWWFQLWQRLRVAMRSYRATHPQLKGVGPEGMCGAGEIVLQVSAKPSDGRVFLIPTFFYQVCRAQGVNPYDMSACDHWREALGTYEEVSGSYRYFVKWHDGAVRQGVLDVDKMEKTWKPLSNEAKIVISHP